MTNPTNKQLQEAVRELMGFIEFMKHDIEWRPNSLSLRALKKVLNKHKHLLGDD